MISTNGIFGTGLKKCIPQKFSGFSSADANSSIRIVDVFEVRIVPAGKSFSRPARTACFTLGFSTTASTTISALCRSASFNVGLILPKVATILSIAIWPRCTFLPSSLDASPIPKSSASWLMSFMIIGVPL